MKLNFEIVIDASLDTVWAAFDNPDNMRRWQTNFHSYTHMSGEPGRPGSIAELKINENGKIVVLNHGKGFSTRYGHNRQVLVKRGDKVKRGQIIGLMGTTGNATGPHCHYEVWHKGRAVNPRKFMKQAS